MKNHKLRTTVATAAAVIIVYIAGCGQQAQTQPADKLDVGATIGALTDVFAPQAIPVEGYAIVGGLRGTGSAQCPPQIRAYLKQYILTQLSAGGFDVDELIDSDNTAVVRVHGLMPAARKGKRFDVTVDALAPTQTTSLQGGWLYKATLKKARTFGLSTRSLATVQGPVFIDTIGPRQADKKTGYILSGGRVRDGYPMAIVPREPDYMLARRISDLLDTRFGKGTTPAASPDYIELKVPTEYAEQRQRFIDIVKAMYLVSTPELTAERIATFTRDLAVSQDKHSSEIALEAIGRVSVGKLSALLNSSNEEVRMRAARCMLYLGDNRGQAMLRTIAMDKASSYRIEALKAITAAANRSDAAFVARTLVRDDDFNVRFAAYEQLLKLDDVTISQTVIAGNFYLEQVAQANRKEIYVSRSGRPRIVLFDAPIYCRNDVFVETDNGSIAIDASPGQDRVSLIRKVPNQPRVVKLNSSFELGEIIRKLAEEPLLKKGTLLRPGLNVSYADTIALIKQMCDTGAVDAEFRAGPLPKIE